MAGRVVGSIVCCPRCTTCINSDGRVFSFGFSPKCAHGFAEKTVWPPKIVTSLKNIKFVCSFDHSVCLDYDGNVFTFGGNDCGQLGIGSNEDSLNYTHVPQKVNLPPCKQVSCGRSFTMCLSENGEIYSFGDNGNGQLGLGNNEDYNSPQLISSLKHVEFIECGSNHTFCTIENNDVYCWGDNYCGQLGLGNDDNQNTPTLCSSLSNEDVIDIKCGNYHTLILTSNGDVLSCGNNAYGQIGRRVYDKRASLLQKIETLCEIIRIECGYNHSMCIDTNNYLYVFGWNAHGQLGLGDPYDVHDPMKHPSFSNIIDISKGGNHTFVKTSNNEIYAFGYNINSQLGIETKYDNQSTPIRVFEDNEDIWKSNINKSKAKSARSVV